MDVSRPCGVNLLCQRVTANYFDVLRVPMALGRGFRPEEDRLNAPTAVAVLSYGTWETRFGGDVGVVGRTLMLRDLPYTIVGITARSFSGTSPNLGRTDVWLPYAAILLRSSDADARSHLTDTTRFDTFVAGRLAPGATLDHAHAELTHLSAQFRSHLYLDVEGREVLVTGTSGLFAPPDRQIEWPLVRGVFGAAALVLLLACANVGNLQLARAIARRQEIAVRLSLGASRARILRQLLTESLLLACSAGVVGIGIASVLPAFLSPFLDPDAIEIRWMPNLHVIGFALGAACVSCVAFGLTPALHGTRDSIDAMLKVGSRSVPTRAGMRRGLVAVQIAITFALLCGAGLLLRAAQHVRGQDLGFTIENVNVLSFSVDTDDETRQRAFAERLRAELASAPGLSFGLADALPFEGKRTFASLPGEGEDRRRVVANQAVSAGYFDVLEIPMVAGRRFEPGDEGQSVVLVNQSLARLYWPGGTPLGQGLVVRRHRYQIVGVVQDTRTADLDRVEPCIYQLIAARTIPQIVVRDPGGHLTKALAAVVGRLDPRVQVTVAPLSENVDRWLEPSRQGAALVMALGMFALGVAAVGLAGLMGYEVQRRTPEIGIRMALGAQSSDVVVLVLAYASRTVVIGVAAGVALAAGTSSLLRSYLYGLSPLDPIVYVGICALLAVTALATSYVPVRRAVRLDPTVALRSE
jgi:predicted permease